MDKIIKATFGLSETEMECINLMDLVNVGVEIYKWVVDKINSLKGENEKLPLDTLIKLHSLKTGALIKASALLGCLAAGVSLSDERIKDVNLYAENIGLAFQIVDDLLDVTGDPKLLGKNIGMDEKNDTVTFAKLFSYEEAFDKAVQYSAQACAAVSQFESSEILIDLAKDLLMRNN